jgi:hypothetical protein
MWIKIDNYRSIPIRNKERKQQEYRGEISENEREIQSEISDLFLIGKLS